MLVVILVNLAAAETLRVTTWNLGTDSKTQSIPALIEQAAATLRNLEPDMILLQRVKDWDTCTKLAEALRPLNYNVLICSAFRQASPGMPTKAQIAILSKSKAYFTWSENWSSQKQEGLANGVAFAAIQVGTQRLGVFTAAFGDHPSGNEVAQRLLGQINSVRGWETNQVQTFVVSASFDHFTRKSATALHQASLAFEQAGLVDATERMPQEQKTTLRANPGQRRQVADCLFAGPMGFPSRGRTTASPASDHDPLTCELELDPDKVTNALDIRAVERRRREVETALTGRKTLYYVAGGLVLGLVVFAIFRIVSKRRARTAVSPRNLLPVRVAPRNAPAQLRPIVFAQSPAKTRIPERPALPEAPRPALRLQKPIRKEDPKAASQEPPEPAPPPTAEQSQVIELEDAAVPNPAITQDTEVRQSVIRDLSGWLKQKLVSKLVTDRAQLLEAQKIATHMATTLDNRLARIEAQIHQQNQAYARRIEQLNQELAAAREENRELIRERIEQVKAEMEAARARVLEEADLDSSSLRL
jgi:hypothetical protein